MAGNGRTKVRFPDCWSLQGARTAPAFRGGSGRTSFLVMLQKNGRSAPGTVVHWSARGQRVRLSASETVTDAAGIATVSVTAPRGSRSAVTAEAPDGTRLVGDILFEHPTDRAATANQVQGAGQQGSAVGRRGPVADAGVRHAAPEAFAVVSKAAASAPAQLAFTAGLAGRGYQGGKLSLDAPLPPEMEQPVAQRPGLPGASHTGGRLGQSGYFRLLPGAAVPDGAFSEGLWWGADYSKPVYETDRHTILWEWGIRAAKRYNLGDTGLVYRYLLPGHAVLGLNLFFDKSLDREHAAASVGAEAMGGLWQLGCRYFVPFTDWKHSDPSVRFSLDTVPHGFALQERLMRKKLDVNLDLFMPGYRPLAASARYARSLGEHVDESASAQTTSFSSARVEGRLSWRATSFVKLSVGRRFFTGMPQQLRFLLELGFNLDQPLADQLRSRSGKTAPGAVSLQGMRRQFVSRSSDMALQYRTVPSAQHVAGTGPGAGITIGTDLTIPAGGAGAGGGAAQDIKAGDSVTIKAKFQHADGMAAMGIPVRWNLTPSVDPKDIDRQETITDSQGEARIVLTSTQQKDVWVSAEPGQLPP